MSFLEKAWYDKAGWLIVLWPFAVLFRLLTAARRKIQQTVNRPAYVTAPVVVIGNISLGGTGKTPLLLNVVAHLQSQNMKPGIISRGYGGNSASYPLLVQSDTPVTQCGDEAKLIQEKTGVPVVVDPDRVAALKFLLTTHPDTDVVLSDDGLQHYRLWRDIEIAVVDGERQFGNGWCLPAGPLREPPSRLDEVDHVVVNGDKELPIKHAALAHMTLKPRFLVNLSTGEKKPFGGAPFNMGNLVQAVCGLGNPQRFYALLEHLPYQVQHFTFPDHFEFSEQGLLDAGVDPHQPIVMTEKDAVKCEAFARSNFWVLTIDVSLPEEFLATLTDRIRTLHSQITAQAAPPRP